MLHYRNNLTMVGIGKRETYILILAIITLAVCQPGVYEVNSGKESFKKLQREEEDDTMTEPGDKANEKDMFLGDYIKGFRNLDPSQQKERLEEFLKKEVDSDNDGFISEEELRKRFRQTNRKYKKQEVEETMKKQDDNLDGKVSWEEFSRGQYEDEEDKEYKEKDERNFRHADRNGDNKLDFQEYVNYHNPLDDPRMSKFLIDQDLKKYDKDNDGKISMEEFENSDTFDDLNENTRKELKIDFNENYDLNHDGKLDRDELVPWSITDAEFIRDSPKNLARDGDINKDGKLSYDEIYKNLDHYLDAPLNMGGDKAITNENKHETKKEKELKKPHTEL